MNGMLFALVAGAVGIVVLILMARRWGKQAAEKRALEGRLEAVQQKQEIDDDVAQLGSVGLRSELGRFVRRPKG